MMLQPPRGREVRFYEWEGRGKERDGTAQMPRLFFSPFFVNGRAERLGRAELRRLHFYEWGGLRMVLRRRYIEIFMNGKKWRMRCVYVCVCVPGVGVFTRAMSGLLYITRRLIWPRCQSRFIFQPVHAFNLVLPAWLQVEGDVVGVVLRNRSDVRGLSSAVNSLLL